ncbi:hypothetical protein BDR22DRAFT_90585 [Usnea florida]
MAHAGRCRNSRPSSITVMVHRLSDILCDCRVMAQNILYSIFACLPCKMHRPIWAEHQPLATSPCPPLLYQYMSSSLRTLFHHSQFCFTKSLSQDRQPVSKYCLSSSQIGISRRRIRYYSPGARGISLSEHLIALLCPIDRGIAGQRLKIIKAKAFHIPIVKYPSLPRIEGGDFIPRLHYLNIQI